ncbi:uroporphyrinogen decarboxylase [Lewinella marina]|uniref:Uroporphyrinogen decarboxylase n=1 Tax=Neolewinella marina TaxID=438751 RepID=A0A2G0CFJ2_9BACT|nr:uroporphyrinogen decarboxylase [Neolewinella marina]NJB85584.1 uroporphyrinogen decarboxylase [Neolewinella marina]PHK98732.1 uroporphyrinogen decarboxylase [Neolewinella marina]
MYQNDLFLRAARGESVERPPVWLMRQAGRILPQYRALRASLSGFKELVSSPDLAAEVTIQPVDELGVDAAIIFSDILVIPEALGLDYTMVEKVGPRFPRTIRSQADVDALRPAEEAPAHLGYVFDALDATKRRLDNRVPLIGFAGAPWTIFAYMVEGGGSKTFSKARRMLYQDPQMSHRLLEKITTATAAYLKKKVRHGADLIQLFDSWAGVLPPNHYQEFSLRYIEQLCRELEGTPVTVFAKDARHAISGIGKLPCQVVQLDWIADVERARTLVPGKVLQGNMDPAQLYAPTDQVAEATRAMLDRFGRHHIANLGHGVYPDTPLEGVKAFVNAVKDYRYAD